MVKQTNTNHEKKWRIVYDAVKGEYTIERKGRINELKKQSKIHYFNDEGVPLGVNK